MAKIGFLAWFLIRNQRFDDQRRPKWHKIHKNDISRLLIKKTCRHVFISNPKICFCAEFCQNSSFDRTEMVDHSLERRDLELSKNTKFDHYNYRPTKIWRHENGQKWRKIDENRRFWAIFHDLGTNYTIFRNKISRPIVCDQFRDQKM